MPRVTYSDPELAAVGLDEAAARARHGAIRILRWPFAATDRAQTEGRTQGLVKVIVTPRGRILGAGIVGRSEEHTSELQSIMSISYAVFCLKKKKQTTISITTY